MTVFAKLWKAFSDLPEVTAIALGGSRSGETYDETSDYDFKKNLLNTKNGLNRFFYTQFQPIL